MKTALLSARLALAAASLGLALAFFGFWRTVSSAATDYSWGDSSYHTQIFFNFTAGHPFQMSIYHNPSNGVFANPAPYASQASVHPNFTPFLFAPLFALHPDLYGLYALTIGVVMLSACAAIFDIFKTKGLAASEARVRRALALALLCSSPLFRLAHYKGHMLLFATPFFLGMNAAARRRNIPLYLVFAALTAFVGEDSALLVISHSAYLWLCDRDLRRPAILAALGSAAVFGLMVFVLMPAARFGMIQENSSHVGYVLTHSEGLLRGIKIFLREIRIAMIFLPALAALRFAFDPGPRSSDRRLLALILIAPASHWAVTLFTYGEHHLMPPLLCMILAAALLLSDGVLRLNDVRRRKAAILCAAVYALLAAWNVLKDVPRPTPAQIAESAQNLAFISGVRALVPRDATLVVWSDEPVESFLADRVSLWRFPEFYADADYLAIEPGAQRSWLKNPPTSEQSLEETARAPSWGDEQPIPPGSAAAIKDELVGRLGTHAIVREDSNLLLLKRKISKRFPILRSSEGLGYLRNFPAVLRRR